MKFNSIRITKRDNTLFIPLPKEAQEPINCGCDCNYCKANRDKTPMWDTLAVSPDSEWTWTVHYPELQR